MNPYTIFVQTINLLPSFSPFGALIFVRLRQASGLFFCVDIFTCLCSNRPIERLLLLSFFPTRRGVAALNSAGSFFLPASQRRVCKCVDFFTCLFSNDPIERSSLLSFPLPAGALQRLTRRVAFYSYDLQSERAMRAEAEQMRTECDKAMIKRDRKGVGRRFVARNTYYFFCPFVLFSP